MIILIIASLFVGGGHWEGVTTSWPVIWTLAIGGSSPSPLSLECTFCLRFPQQELFSRTQPWDSNVLLRPSGLDTWLNFVKSSMQTFKILAGACGDLLLLWLPKISLVHKFSCLLNPPLTNLEWSVSFLGLFLPSVYGDQFPNQHCAFPSWNE